MYLQETSWEQWRRKNGGCPLSDRERVSLVPGIGLPTSKDIGVTRPIAGMNEGDQRFGEMRDEFQVR